MSQHSTHKVRTLWLAGILHAFTHLYQMAIIPLYLRIREDLHLRSEGDATLLVTLYNVAYVLPSYGMGVLADKISRKKMLSLGLLINALGFVGLALSPNYPCALASVIVGGFGGSFYHPAAIALVARLFPVKTGRALGLVAIGASLGFFVSPIYSGWRAASTGNWRSPILEFGILGIVFAIVFHWLAEEESAPEKQSSPKVVSAPIFPTPALWMFFLGSAFFFSLRDFAGSAMGSLGSLFLQKARGMDIRTTGALLSCIFLASAFSNPLFGRWSDGNRLRWLVRLLITSALLVAVFPHVPAVWMSGIFLAYGFFFLATYPINEAALMESVPDAVRGRAYGIFITFGGLTGSSSFPLWGFPVSTRFGVARICRDHSHTQAGMKP